jgi:triosephosphate isomerase (TIM)
MNSPPLIAGNWKMNGTGDALGEVGAIARAAAHHAGRVEVALCLPATLIERGAKGVAGGALRIGAQDIDAAADGAHTGCTSAAMVLDAGAVMTIVGHSERREAQHESDAEVRAKASAALAAGLATILCIGESLDVREAGGAVDTVCRQLDSSLPAADAVTAETFAIAYEPIWAIGTGKVPSVGDIGEMHDALRARLVAAFGAVGQGVRILYGGSVKASNAAEIFAVGNVDGALVGGASLTAADFVPIVEAAAARTAG